MASRNTSDAPVAFLSMMAMWAPKTGFAATLTLMAAQATAPVLALATSYGALAPLVGGAFLTANVALAIALRRMPGEPATRSYGGFVVAILGGLGGIVLPAATFISISRLIVAA